MDGVLRDPTQGDRNEVYPLRRASGVCACDVPSSATSLAEGSPSLTCAPRGCLVLSLRDRRFQPQGRGPRSRETGANVALMHHTDRGSQVPLRRLHPDPRHHGNYIRQRARGASRESDGLSRFSILGREHPPLCKASTGAASDTTPAWGEKGAPLAG